MIARDTNNTVLFLLMCSINDKPQIIVIGGGISGLSLAYWLSQSDTHHVTLVEKSTYVGGKLRTRWLDQFQFENGPNSIMDNTPYIGRLLKEVGLTNAVLTANGSAQKRYIVKNHTLHTLSPSPLSLFKTPLFSMKGKLRLLKEPFLKPSNGHCEDESIADFTKRRFGDEFLRYAMSPFVSGVYAGNPEELSVRAALPKLYELESTHGSVVKGLFKSKKGPRKLRLITFKRGMSQLTERLKGSIRGDVLLDTTVQHIGRSKNTYEVALRTDTTQRTITPDIVVTATPAYATAPLIEPLDNDTARVLAEFDYPPIMVIHLVYLKSVVSRALDGFGFLIPPCESQPLLGAMWDSTIFPHRSDANHVTFTLFVGGGIQKTIFEKDPVDITSPIKAFESLMGINAPPIKSAHHIWRHAIPQYTLGHQKRIHRLEQFEKKHPGFYLFGNYRGGISIGDCIRNSFELAKRIMDHS